MIDYSQFAPLIAQPVNWLQADSPEGDIVLSSKIAISRNLANYNFAGNASVIQLLEIADEIHAKLEPSDLGSSEMYHFKVSELTELYKLFLFERHHISLKLIERGLGGELYLSSDESVAISVNESEHLKIQGILAGLNLHELYQSLKVVEDKLSTKFNYAYDEQLGFLASSPRKIGAGLTVSVLLSLPALTLTNEVKGAMNGLRALKFAVKGAYEQSGRVQKSRGNLYQLSTQSLLGESPEACINRILVMVNKLINYEKDARNRLILTHMNMVADRVGRAYGGLQYSYKLSMGVLVDSLSMLRLGVEIKMLKGVSIEQINSLMVNCCNAHLQLINFGEDVLPELGEARADIVRKTLGKKS